MADTRSKTFAENVNHVAELDNSLGYELVLRRSNIVLNENVTYSATTEIRLFNRTTNSTETLSVPSASVTAAGLNTYLGQVKTTLELAYPSCVMTHSVTQTISSLGTFNNAQLTVVLSGNDYYLRSINIKISEVDGIQYDIDGHLTSPLEITPSFISLNAGMLADINSVAANATNINALVANEANIDAVAESLANVNTIASIQNLANMTTVANDLNAMDLNGIADVTVVANNLVLGAASSINIVSADKANIDAVAANKANIDAVAANESNINAVIGSAAATAADVLLTHADVLLTHSDVVLTNADVISADASAAVATTQSGIATAKAGESLASADAANASKVSAASSELNASLSASSAELSATTATAKAGEASVSAINAATSESNADLSEANALASANAAAMQAGIATTKAGEASASAIASATSAALAEAALDDITGLTASATTLVAGASATASYDSGTGILYIGVPQGMPGEAGTPGIGISSIIRTTGDGSSGTTDTYTITYTDATTSTFNVYNGVDGLGSGDMLKSVYDTTNNGKVDVAEVAESVEWDNVANKPTVFTPSSHTHITADITDFPALATVATSGSYEDLSDKPTMPAEYYLPTASGTILGGVKVGANLTITDGVLSADVQSINIDAVPIDETVTHLTSTDATVDTSGNITSYTYSTGNKELYTYTNGILTKIEYTDTDGVTILLTKTITYTTDGIPLITRS